ncbi:MAG: thymidylate kinase [Clostridia bacterium]|nr:thymidylate kinase [Clostridia bacterium]
MAKTIVLEGIDGSGKSTQFALAREALNRLGVPNVSYKFPRYDTPSGVNVRRYLDGDFGSRPEDVGAYAASAFYSVDRVASFRSEWHTFYEEVKNGVVLLDRYTPSNAVHQGAKLPPEERKAYYDWLYHFEFTMLGLPKPDAVLILKVPPAYSRKLTHARGAEDIHERDQTYIEKCYASMMEAADYYGWDMIDCVEGEELLPINVIHEKVMAKILGVLGLSK